MLDLKIQQTLLAGMRVKVIIRGLKEQMQDRCILHTMKVMVVLKTKLIEKSSG